MRLGVLRKRTALRKALTTTHQLPTPIASRRRAKLTCPQSSQVNLLGSLPASCGSSSSAWRERFLNAREMASASMGWEGTRLIGAVGGGEEEGVEEGEEGEEGEEEVISFGSAWW